MGTCTSQEEERERRMDFVPEESAVNTETIEARAACLQCCAAALQALNTQGLLRGCTYALPVCPGPCSLQSRGGRQVARLTWGSEHAWQPGSQAAGPPIMVTNV